VSEIKTNNSHINSAIQFLATTPQTKYVLKAIMMGLVLAHKSQAHVPAHDTA